MTSPYLDNKDNKLSLKKITHIIYALFALGIVTGGVFGFAMIAGVILAYIKRGDASGTVYAAHFDWLLATFWWSLLWFILSGVAILVFVGWITGLIALVWLLYRIIKGWLALLEEKSPKALY